MAREVRAAPLTGSRSDGALDGAFEGDRLAAPLAVGRRDDGGDARTRVDAGNVEPA